MQPLRWMYNVYCISRKEDRIDWMDQIDKFLTFKTD